MTEVELLEGDIAMLDHALREHTASLDAAFERITKLEEIVAILVSDPGNPFSTTARARELFVADL